MSGDASNEDADAAAEDGAVPTDAAGDSAIDAALCVEGAPCTPTGDVYACYTAGRISCALGGVCVGRSDSALDTGASCGFMNSRVCNEAKECVDCLDEGEPCVIDGSCQFGVVSRSAGCECVPDVAGEILESGSSGASCALTETCNGAEAECQSVMSNVASVAVGPNHTCAIVADNAAALSRGETYATCWGTNYRSSLGGGVLSSCDVGRAARVDVCNDDPAVPGTLCRVSVSGPKEIVVGHSTSCFIDSEGAVFCWGNNLNGEVGGPPGTLDGDGIPYRTCAGTPGATPLQERACFELAARRVRLPAGTRVVDLVISHDEPVNCMAGYSNSEICDATGPEWHRVCAVTDEGKLHCWGGVAASGASEVLLSVMRPPVSASPEFYEATAEWRFEKVAMGTGFWCTLVRDRSTTSATRGQTRVLCAGAFANGERGDGLTLEDRGSEVPAFPPAAGTVRAVVGLTDAVDLAASSNFACAVRAAGAASGRVVCWGRLAANSITAAENGGAADVRKPVYVRATSGAPLRYIDASGTIPTPESGDLITGATNVSVSPKTNCVRLSTGRMRCWGRSYLGDGTENESMYGVLPATQPTREVNPGSSLSSGSLATTTSVSMAYNGRSATAGVVGCFIRDYSRRQLFCWGTNATRQLGHCISTTSEARLTPMPVLPYDASMNGMCRAGDAFVAPTTCTQSEP